MAKKAKYYQRKDGLFETIKTINGKRVAFRGHSCREVDQKLLAYREETERGRRFPVVADEWEREHEKTVSEATRVAYRVIVRRLKEHFNGPVDRAIGPWIYSVMSLAWSCRAGRGTASRWNWG